MEASNEAPNVEFMPPVAPWDALPDGEYAIAELMGHTVLVGRITEMERFGTKMAAIEVLFNGALLPPVFQSGSSFYRLTPVSREAAWKRQHKLETAFNLPGPVRALMPPGLLTAPVVAPQTGDEFDEEDDGERY